MLVNEHFLVLNPSARISIQGDTEPPSFLVEAPIKGDAFSVVVVEQSSHPEAHHFLCSALLDGQHDLQLTNSSAEELSRIGLFVSEDAIPASVAYAFPESTGDRQACLTLAQVDSMSAEPVGTRGLRMPAEWRAERIGFVGHRRDSVWAPVIRSEDAPTPSAHPLGHSGHSTDALDDPATCAAFARDGFVELTDLLPAEHVAELARYFGALAREGFLSRDENRGTRRFIAHNHPVANFWHDQLNERVSQLVGRRTKPSYSFVSLYLEGGDLFWHTDRPPCEYTITLLLDYAPLEEGRSPWALKVKGRDGTIHSIHQRIGDALIFKGRELKHSREVLPAGHRSASLLFHFVDEDYDGVME